MAEAAASAETAAARGVHVVAEPKVNDTGFRTAMLADPSGARFSVSQRPHGD